MCYKQQLKAATRVVSGPPLSSSAANPTHRSFFGDSRISIIQSRKSLTEEINQRLVKSREVGYHTAYKWKDVFFVFKGFYCLKNV